MLKKCKKKSQYQRIATVLTVQHIFVSLIAISVGTGVHIFLFQVLLTIFGLSALIIVLQMLKLSKFTKTEMLQLKLTLLLMAMVKYPQKSFILTVQNTQSKTTKSQSKTLNFGGQESYLEKKSNHFTQ